MPSQCRANVSETHVNQLRILDPQLYAEMDKASNPGRATGESPKFRLKQDPMPQVGLWTNDCYGSP
jgi:hypothetical protein